VSTDRRGDDIPTGYNTFFNFYSPEGEEINDGQQQVIKDWFQRFEDVLYGSDFRDPETGYRAYIDVDSFIDHLLLNNLTKNKDGLQLSTWLYLPSPEAKLRFGPIFDFDRAYNSNGSATADLNFGHQFLWMPRLFQDPDFEQDYIDRWQQLRMGPFSTENMRALIDAQAAEITEQVALATGVSNWANRLSVMKNWLATRAAAKDRLYTPMPSFRSDQPVVPPGHPLEITAEHGIVYYTTDGTDPRALGGAISASARVYETPIEVQQTTTIVARARDGADWSGPIQIRIETASPGDANRDGRFTSADLIQVLQAGEYEDGIDDNSTWEDGDWNGDGDFTTADLIAALQTGMYEAALAAAVAADPGSPIAADGSTSSRVEMPRSSSQTTNCEANRGFVWVDQHFLARRLMRSCENRWRRAIVDGEKLDRLLDPIRWALAVDLSFSDQR
jgi:hypothetical protein